jgi:hypothetical protein
MKKSYSLLALLVLVVTVLAQSPQKMSYQAVVRNNDNSLVINQPVGVKITVLQGTDNGNTVYSELFNPNPETNANGLLTLEIGGGIPVSGTFSEIDWSKGPFFIRTEIDPSGGSNYTVTGTTPLLSVPFALHAHSVENDKVDDADNDPANEIQQLNLSGTTLSLSKGGGSVTLPTSGEGGSDNWGSQSVVSDATLDGAGTSASPLKLADNGVTSAKIADGAVTGSKIESGAISSDKIESGAVTGTKIAQSGASSGQVLKWDGAQWSPGEDESGEDGFSLPYAGSTLNFSLEPAFSISGAVTGILGEALYAGEGGIPVGIHGKSLVNLWGTGVLGQGYYTGLWGESEGYGVYGEGNTGVFGDGSGSSGTAIRGISRSTTGTTYGVRSEVRSSSGFSGHFKGGKFYVDGRVGLGTESPAATLHINHTNGTAGLMPNQGLRIQNTSATNRFWTLYTFSSNGALALYSGTGDGVSVGNFNAGTGAYTATSNRHLKTNISLLGSDILDKIALLKPARYSYIRDPMNQMTIGFMAEDVQLLFPELVDAVGENSENMAINYAGFSVVAIKAIQQQQKQMEALQTENEQLKKRLDRLENLVASTAQKGNE